MNRNSPIGSFQQRLFPVEETKVVKHRDRKNHNQYFTPYFAVEKALSYVSGIEVKNIVDPAVGDGIFLKIASKIWREANLFGVDIDKEIISDLTKFNLPNSYLFCSDSLLPKTWQEVPEIQAVLSEGGVDLVVGNPPFSSWFNRIESPEVLSRYQLALNERGIKKSQAIEVLFLEIFIRLAKNKGFIIIVLPDGLLSNPQYKYARKFILQETIVKNIISLPRNVFRDTSAKTSILILQKRGIGNLDYLTKIGDLEKSGVVNNIIKVKGVDLINRMDYYYYHNLRKSSVNELISNGVTFRPLKDFIVYCKTGKTIYGENRKFSEKGLRFIHATNITEIGVNYKRDERFIEPKSKMNFPSAHAKTGDILFVRVGVGCAGRVAIIDTKEEEGVATDYIHILRVKGINPYFLVVYLKTNFGKDSINLLKHGVGTVSINKSDILSLPIPITPENIQLEIERRYKAIFDEYRRKDENNKVKDKMDSLIRHLEDEIMNLKGNYK